MVKPLGNEAAVRNSAHGGHTSRKSRGMGRIVWALFAFSTAGPLLVQLVLRRLGRTGGVVAEGVICSLLVRAIAMVGGGAPRRLQRLPRLLLALECIMDAAAALVGFWTWVWQPFGGREAARGTKGPAQGACLSIAAVWTVFALHTIRLGIYLSPNRGLRANGADQVSQT